MYPSNFNRLRYSEILVGNCNFSLGWAGWVVGYENEPMDNSGVFPLEFREKFGPHKTRIMGLPGSEDSVTIG